MNPAALSALAVFGGASVGSLSPVLSTYVLQRRVARTGQGVCGDHLQPFSATVSVEDNLRIVLSRMYQFNSSWMPVIDGDGHYVGEVTQDSIADYLSSGRSRHGTGQPAAIVSPAVVAAQGR